MFVSLCLVYWLIVQPLLLILLLQSLDKNGILGSLEMPLGWGVPLNVNNGMKVYLTIILGVLNGGYMKLVTCVCIHWAVITFIPVCIGQPFGQLKGETHVYIALANFYVMCCFGSY